MTMRIDSIVLPLADNDGNSLADVHAALRAQLCEMFGGFTGIETFGGWKDDSGKLYMEKGVKYDIACEPTDSATIDSLALFYGHMSKQLAVMVTHGGAPEFITIPMEENAAQKSLEFA